MTNKIYHTVGTFPKGNRKILEIGKIDTPNTQIRSTCVRYVKPRGKI